MITTQILAGSSPSCSTAHEYFFMASIHDIRGREVCAAVVILVTTFFGMGCPGRGSVLIPYRRLIYLAQA